jgi:hypothetical protein
MSENKKPNEQVQQDGLPIKRNSLEDMAYHNDVPDPTRNYRDRELNKNKKSEEKGRG